jgi:isopentenyldiphosphate isomerase
MTNINFENQRLLDVIDEDDKVIGSISRAEAHRRGLLHREIHVWMFDKDLNIIFQKRGLHKASAGLLDATVGGHVDHGEDYLESAIREAKEETNIKINPSDLLLLKKIRGKDLSQGLGVTNNFLRAIYVYKNPVDYTKIKKEKGIPAGGFQKLAPEFLSSLRNDDTNTFIPFVFKEELPYIVNYIK